MAIFKEITISGGVPVNYHRIVSLQKITNEANIIEVASYTSETKRLEEQEALKEARTTGEATNVDIFIHTEYIHLDYDENMSIENAYEYLKTLDMFSNADNV